MIMAHAWPKPSGIVLLATLLLPMLVGCSSPPGTGRHTGSMATAEDDRRLVALQATVMSMADDWNIALGESFQGLQAQGSIDLRARIEGMWFLRNGMGASLDIAAGPNPEVAILDLLVLASLQEWAIDHTWRGHGIPDARVLEARERLRDARGELERKAAQHLTPQQRAELDQLIGAWIAAHPGRMLVAFVRFSDFADERNNLTLVDRQRAESLLREVDQVTAAIDDARLLGERALWYAARYPYVLGQQAELTALQVAESISVEVARQRDSFFERLAAERDATLGAVDQAREDLLPILQEARQTIDAARSLGTESRGAIEAIDRLAARFEPDAVGEDGLSADELLSLVRESRTTADRFTNLVRAGHAALEDDSIDGAADRAERTAVVLIDRLLWGGAGLILLVALSQIAVRMLTRRGS